MFFFFVFVLYSILCGHNEFYRRVVFQTVQLNAVINKYCCSLVSCVLLFIETTIVRLAQIFEVEPYQTYLLAASRLK